ncbi:MAG TPA: DUF952 domain-containing protein [Anaerolineales bacterium]|nr:DUF952 domain-containing protein [Anaerolineales bacterium]
MIYHICKIIDWENANIASEYRADSLESEGLIHCSTSTQVPRVLNSFYKGQQDLALLVIDLSRLEPQVKWEPGLDKPDELFPHVFGPINLDAIDRTITLPINADGNFKIPSLG